MFCEKGVLKNVPKFTEKHLCQSLFFITVPGLRPATLLKERLLEQLQTLAQVFPCEFRKNFKNTFFYRAPLVAASKTFVRKPTTHAKKKLTTIYIKSSYPFAIQYFFIFLFSASYDILKTRVFRNNAILLRVYLM